MTESIGSTITRRFSAPPEAVFDAWVTPASFAVWWGGSGVEVPLASLSLDARPGGAWKAVMILGEDSPGLLSHGEFLMRGEYLEVDRPNRLVMTMTNEPIGDERELLTVTFTAVEGGTEMLFSQTGGHLSAEEYQGTTIGWRMAFDALDTILPVAPTEASVALPEAMTGRASPAKAAVGDKPVFAYIAGLPQPQRGIAEAIDALAAATLPDLQRSVKWGMSYYGVGDGWCFSCGGFAGHVKLMFVNGTALDPVPPVTPVGMGKATRGIEPQSVGELDEHQIAAWMRQATSVPGVGGKR